MVAFVNPSTSGERGQSEQVLCSTTTPIGIAPTGSVGANGAVTLGTSLPTTFSGGIYLYYPAGAVFSGSAAGFYWTVMSNGVSGTVYNNAPGRIAYPPASATAIVDAGPGAFTGATGSRTAASITVPGKLLGPNGQLVCNVETGFPNNANTKQYAEVFGGNTLVTHSRTTTAHDSFTMRYKNDGTETRGSFYPASESSVAAVTTFAYFSVNTAANADWEVTLNTAVAADYVILFSMTLTVIPGV